jgi:hypothetical protein
MHETGLCENMSAKFQGRVQLQRSNTRCSIIQEAEEIVAPLLAFNSAPSL